MKAHNEGIFKLPASSTALFFFRLFPGGRVPYSMDTSFNDLERQVIAAAINDIEDNSCVRWSPWFGNESPHVLINRQEGGCFADIGATVDGVLNLGTGCIVSDIKEVS